MSELTREQFVQHLIQQVHDRFPLVKIARAPQPFSVLVNGHMASLENLYRITVLDPAQMQRHIEQWMLDTLRAIEGHPDHSGTYEELKPRIMPVLTSQRPADLHENIMVTQPFVADLVIAYAVDQQRTIDYIPQSHFKTWDISIDELHETAMNNLVARSQSLPAHAAEDDEGRINLIVFQTMDGYDATRLLLPNLHDRLREFLGSPFLAAVPNRDILLCFRDDKRTVNHYRKQIRQDYLSMPHQITDRLLLVTPDGVAAYT